MQALLYLPRGAAEPYQAMIFMGGAGTFARPSSATEADIFGCGYERSDGYYPLTSSKDSFREKSVQWVKVEGTSMGRSWHPCSSPSSLD